MRKILTANEMREVDRLTTEKFGVPSIDLMENAAASVVRAIAAHFGGTVAGLKIAVVSGRGNNGGDGAAVARLLQRAGAAIRIWLAGRVEDTRGDAHVNFERIAELGREGKVEFLESAAPVDIDLVGFDCVVDALFGTGLARPLEGDWARFVEKISRSDAFRVAVDLPSGLDSDRSDPIGPRSVADLTVSFTAPKLANVFPPASNDGGKLIVADIGSPQELIDDSPSRTFVADIADAREWLHHTGFEPGSYKNKRGHALLVVGSRDYAGAAALAGNAAMRSGAGLVTVATTRSAQVAIASKTVEEVITRGLPEDEEGRLAFGTFSEIGELAERADAVAIGCGLGLGANRESVKQFIERCQKPVIIDADGLNALAPFDLGRLAPTVLTPHEGEFLRLLGSADRSLLADRIGAARTFAVRHGVFLVLKGERVLIGAPDGRVVINPTGNPGLGKAGNGDTLTGVIAGFVAQATAMGIDLFQTVVAAVYIAGLAGDIAAERFGHRAMAASDVRDALAESYARCLVADG